MPDPMTKLECLFFHEKLSLYPDRVATSQGELNLNRDIQQARITVDAPYPFQEALTSQAVVDVESNIVEEQGQRYFGAGRQFGFVVFTRDIALSGLLGLNRLYPEVMLSSLKVTRERRWNAGFLNHSPHHLVDSTIPWQDSGLDWHGFTGRYRTGSYFNRTDDVCWLWCASDLLENMADPDWEWLYQEGIRFNERFYEPFRDPQDGLYRGQPCFVDVAYPDPNGSGYDADLSLQEHVELKALSTNSLYYAGFQAIARAAVKTGRPKEAITWTEKAEELKADIREHLRNPDGSWAYYQRPDGTLTRHRDAFGLALAVHSGIIDATNEGGSLVTYPVTDAGIPLFDPFFDNDIFYHNHSSWPFVEAIFLSALEKITGKSTRMARYALLARTCINDGSFHEVVDYRKKEVTGSSAQLWTAASWLNTILHDPDIRTSYDGCPAKPAI